MTRCSWLIVVFVAAALPGQDGIEGGKAVKPAAVRWEEHVLVTVRESLRANRTVPRIDPAEQAAIDAAWSAGATKQLAAIADRLVKRHPESDRGYTLRYLVQLELHRDRPAATKTALEALRKLHKHPEVAATFILRALLSQPTLNDYQVALMALVPLLADAKGNRTVRIAHVRALLGCGKAKEALRTHGKIVTEFAGKNEDLIALTGAICDTKGGAAFHKVASAALAAVAADRGGSDALDLLRFRVLCLAGEDARAAALGKRIVRSKGSTSGVNLWLWYLMGERQTRGRYARLGRIAGNHILASGPSNYDMDTAALGLFLAGDHAAALRAQESALSTLGTAPTEGMRRRLRIYGAVAAAAKAKERAAAGKKRR